MNTTDEALHGYYFGAKFQSRFQLLDEAKQHELQTYAYDLLSDLYENECKYTESLYDAIGLSEDVKKFLRYNANKALMNLGFEPLFLEHTTKADQAVLSALEAQVNHDFFSGSGADYIVATVKFTTDSDWAGVLESASCGR